MKSIHRLKREGGTVVEIIEMVILVVIEKDVERRVVKLQFCKSSFE